MLPIILNEELGVSCLVDSGASRSVLKASDLTRPYATDNTVRTVGITGQPVYLKETIPLKVRIQGEPVPGLVKFLLSDTCATHLLGADLLSAMQAVIQYKDGDVYIKMNNPILRNETVLAAIFMSQVEQGKWTPLDLKVPEEVWSKGKTDVGLLPVTPVKLVIIPGTKPFSCKQYPLSQEQIQAIGLQIEDYTKAKVIRPCRSPWNTPLFPVKKKATGDTVTYRMVHDLR